MSITTAILFDLTGDEITPHEMTSNKNIDAFLEHDETEVIRTELEDGQLRVTLERPSPPKIDAQIGVEEGKKLVDQARAGDLPPELTEFAIHLEDRLSEEGY